MSQPVPRLSSLFKLEYPQSVGVYDTYDDAQRIVDFLADERFPVENLCIVGTELRSIERVLGRRSWRTVIGNGVQSGISTGLMITLLMWIFQPAADFLVLVLSALAVGILVGIAFSAIGYWMSQGKRDFRSVSQTIATKYEVLAEHKVAGKARELVSTMPGARAAQFNPATFPPVGSAPAQSYPQGYLPPQGYPPAQGYPPQGYPPAPGYPAQGGLVQAYPAQPYPPQSYAAPTTPVPSEPEEPARPSPAEGDASGDGDEPNKTAG